MRKNTAIYLFLGEMITKLDRIQVYVLHYKARTKHKNPTKQKRINNNRTTAFKRTATKATGSGVVRLKVFTGQIFAQDSEEVKTK